jgi:uncharacterized protein
MSQEEESQKSINVEVAYATPDRQLIIALIVSQGTTAYEAILLSKIVDEFPAIKPDKDKVGIFSKPLDGITRPGPKDYVLQELDRVEIYRPLIIDPKQARVERATKKSAAKK